MLNLRILFISYWPLSDVLTQAAVLPNLSLLKQTSSISEVLLVTIERETNPQSKLLADEFSFVKHIPIHSRNYSISLLNKANDFIVFPKQLLQVVKQQKVDMVLAHGAMAGALAFKVWQSINVPFYVSLFEPHADYMLDSGVWSKFSLKYNLQKRWEKMQKKHALGLMPVANNYKQTLLAEGVAAEKIRVVPCVTDNLAFAFDPEKRAGIRKQLKWESATIGIYAGKYGGLYYDEEAFKIYRRCFELMPDFRLLILSPQPREEIQQQLQKYKIDSGKVHIASVPHKQVPDYLSAADFAFATYKPGPSKKYLSPVKIGEYWANGLPVLLTEGVGDETDIIKKEGGGALIDLKKADSLEQAIQQIQTILQDPTHRQEIPELALKYRSVEMLREAYDYFFNQLQQKA